jgi:hypothetical protein
MASSAVMVLRCRTTKITDRCWQRTLAANPASKQLTSSETAARGSGSVHLLVRSFREKSSEPRYKCNDNGTDQRDAQRTPPRVSSRERSQLPLKTFSPILSALYECSHQIFDSIRCKSGARQVDPSSLSSLMRRPPGAVKTITAPFCGILTQVKSKSSLGSASIARMKSSPCAALPSMR